MEHLEGVGLRLALGTLYHHLVFLHLCELDFLEIGDHVGGEVVLRVVNLIADLLRASGLGDHAASSGDLGDEEGSVLGHLHDGKAQVTHAGHILLARLGEIAAR